MRRLSRRQLPSVSADGTLTYATPGLGPGADMEWVSAGSGSISPCSGGGTRSAHRGLRRRSSSHRDHQAPPDDLGEEDTTVPVGYGRRSSSHHDHQLPPEDLGEEGTTVPVAYGQTHRHLEEKDNSAALGYDGKHRNEQVCISHIPIITFTKIHTIKYINLSAVCKHLNPEAL